MALTPTYRSQLRAQAHSLNPVVITGTHGLTDAVIEEINRALEDHELIKVRLNTKTRDERLAWATHICERLLAECVQTIGHIAVIYRKRKPVKKDTTTKKPVEKKAASRKRHS